MRRALLACLLAAFAAAPADASQVRFTGAQIRLEEEGSEPNSVRLAVAGDRVEISDAAGVEPADEACEAVSATLVRCPVPSAGVEAVLGAGPNLLEVDEGSPLAVVAYGGEQVDRFQGGPLDDRLYGGPGTDRLAGGAGTDLLRGHVGDDLLLGGDGDDELLGEGGFDDLDGGAGKDAIDGGYDRDRLRFADRAAGVRVSLEEGALADAEDAVRAIEIVEGTPFADVIQGGGADEQIDAGDGDDRVSGGLGADSLAGGGGEDLLLGDSTGLDAPSTAPGGAGADDTIRGGPGADAIRGDFGRDAVDGEDGEDVVDAREAEPTQEARQEIVRCGAGADRALFDWNDEGVECENVSTAARPGVAPPPVTVTGPPPVRGPGPQPVLGAPVQVPGGLQIPVFCGRARACTARLTVRPVRTVRIRGRTRSRAGRSVVRRTAGVAAGSAAIVELRLPPGARRGRVVVELRMGGERWARPLVLSRRALGS